MTRPTPMLVLTSLLGSLGCTSKDNPAREEAEPAITALTLDLPGAAGLQLFVDGVEHQLADAGLIVVESGSHEVKLVTPCGSAGVTVDVAEGTTTPVAADRFAELGFAKLRVQARSLEGEILPTTITVGDSAASVGKDGWVAVPACKLRVHVAATQGDLGGLIEDIDFDADKTYDRQIVLAPGPDMVRIHGGPFTLGPPKWLIEKWEEDDPEWFAEVMDRRIVRRTPVQVATFDLDRTEVTAGQFQACRAATKNKAKKLCYSSEECTEMGGCPHDVMKPTGDFEPASPYGKERLLESCNAGPPGGGDRTAKQGREEHPMNCVTRWEAEYYCRWVGKRLPTEAEWEYAARSGNEDYVHPWGNEEGGVRTSIEDPYAAHVGYRKLFPSCSYPKGNSEHAVCDLMGSVSEYVRPLDLPGLREPAEPILQEMSTVDHVYFYEIGLGFRCAREVKVVDASDDR